MRQPPDPPGLLDLLRVDRNTPVNLGLLLRRPQASLLGPAKLCYRV
jgi:hypothetical protein